MSSRDIANLKQGLVAAWIPSLGSTGYRLVDRVGSNHGVLTNMDAGSDWVPSGGALSLDFDGSNDYVAANNQPILSTQYTISAWVYARTPATESSIAALRSSTTTNPVAFQLFLLTSKATFTVRDDAGNIAAIVGNTVSANQWNLITGVRRGNTVEVFMNGVSAGTATATLGTITANSLLFGATNVGGSITLYFDGQLDDIRIYNRALSATEVSLLSKERGIGFKTSSRTSSVFAKRYAYKPPKDKTYAAITRSQSDYDSLREGLVLAICPSVSGATGYRAVDVSGRGNHGSLVNMDAASDWVASNGMALDFDGSDDYVTASDARLPLGNPSFSVSAWLRMPSLTVDGVLRFGNSQGTLTAFGLYANIRGTGIVSGEFAGNNTFYGTSKTISANTWHHVTFTKTSGAINATAKIYIDGTEVTNITASSGTPNITSLAMLIGLFDFSQADYFGGQLDDIRIYNRALTPPEIRQLASRRGIGLQSRTKQFTYYQFPSGSKRRRILTGMP
jgi:hypothetical protein